MSQKPSPHDDARFDDEEYVRRHLEAAGPRPETGSAESAATREAVEQMTTAARAEFEKLWARPARPEDPIAFPSETATGAPRAGWSPARLALAAGVLVAALATVWWLGARSGTAPAIVERVQGAVGGGLETGDAVPRDRWIETGDDGIAALRLADGASLRIDRGSRLRFLSPVLVELLRGAVYVDTGAGSHARRRITIATPAGAVWDIGTQFEVRLLAGNELAIRVREGRVETERDDRRHVAEAGQELVVHADGSATSAPLAPFGEPWSWTMEIAPELAFGDLTVGELLEWVARETGWQVRFEDPATENEARNLEILGSPTAGDRRPDSAAQRLLPTAGLEASEQDGVLTIRRLER